MRQRGWRFFPPLESWVDHAIFLVVIAAAVIVWIYALNK